MSIRLITEVMDYAPITLTPREMYVLIVLAETANEDTRQCWPGYEGIGERSERHRRRVRCSRSGYYDALKSLAAKGALEVLERGHNGRQAVYRIPNLACTAKPDAASSVRETGTLQRETKGPENPDPTSRVASGFSVSSVRKTRTPTPQISSNKETPQREGARARRTPASTNTPRRTRLPADFAATDEMRAWCAKNVADADVDAETGKFIDWCLSRGTTSANWEAEWRNWMRKTERFGNTVGSSRSTTDERVQQGAELVEYFERLEAGEAGIAPPRVLSTADRRVMQALEAGERLQAMSDRSGPPRRSTTDERVQQGLELVERFRRRRLAVEAGKDSAVIEGEIVERNP